MGNGFIHTSWDFQKFVWRIGTAHYVIIFFFLKDDFLKRIFLINYCYTHRFTVKKGKDKQIQQTYKRKKCTVLNIYTSVPLNRIQNNSRLAEFLRWKVKLIADPKYWWYRHIRTYCMLTLHILSTADVGMAKEAIPPVHSFSRF